jgi:hypothetical protein
MTVVHLRPSRELGARLDPADVRHLWLMVVQRSVADVTVGGTANCSDDMVDYGRDAWLWFFSGDRDSECSFLNICEAIDLDWRAVRRRVLDLPIDDRFYAPWMPSRAYALDSVRV